MRLAFIATRIQDVVQCRRRRRREIRTYQRSSWPYAFNIPNKLIGVEATTTKRAGGFGMNFDDVDSFVVEEKRKLYYAYNRHISHSRLRRRISDTPFARRADSQDLVRTYRRLLTAWHLTSVGLFFFACLMLAGIMSVTSDNVTPSKTVNVIGLVSDDVELHLDTSETTAPNSCDKYEYYFLAEHSSSRPTFVEMSSSSVGSSTSAFPNIENVLSIWLRASRSSNPDLPSSLYALASNNQARERYKYYFDSSGGNMAQESSISIVNRRPTTTSNTPTRFYFTDSRVLDTGFGKTTTKLPQCELFDEDRIEDICSLDSDRRIKKLRRVYVRTNLVSNRNEIGNNNHFTNSTNDGSSSPLTLYEFFNLTAHKDADLARPNVAHLAIEFRPCLLSTTVNNDSLCRTCYKTILNRLDDVDSRQENFSNSVLSMVDCEPDNFLEQFSPTSNCSECKIWYRRWLLVTLTGLWKRKPCLQWCVLAELACPHLPPVRKNDYAGLPSFRCKDPKIASSSYLNDCLHPCDPLSPTVRWGWNVIGEKPEFCRNFRPQEFNRRIIHNNINVDQESKHSMDLRQDLNQSAQSSASFQHNRGSGISNCSIFRIWPNYLILIYFLDLLWWIIHFSDIR